MFGIKAVLIISLVINVFVNGYQDEGNLDGELEVLLKRLRERLEDEERGYELQDLFEKKSISARGELQAKLFELNKVNRLGKKFKIFDDDRSWSLSLEEFSEGIHDMGISASAEDIKAILTSLDVDGDGSLSLDEFYDAAKPVMSEARKTIIETVFKKADKNGDGVIDPADMKGVFNVRYNPDYKSGRKTEEQLFEAILNNYEPDVATRDGKVTLAEFTKYYSSMLTTYSDADFAAAIRSFWTV
ncbi:calcyphosin-like [Asterias amurensis]|uniref:calcyphosin-like n=1 Tax=Asterias amurensis TaxID=7602 RepID=UPI003AB2812F